MTKTLDEELKEAAAKFLSLQSLKAEEERREKVELALEREELKNRGLKIALVAALDNIVPALEKSLSADPEVGDFECKLSMEENGLTAQITVAQFGVAVEYTLGVWTRNFAHSGQFYEISIALKGSWNLKSFRRRKDGTLAVDAIVRLIKDKTDEVLKKVRDNKAREDNAAVLARVLQQNLEVEKGVFDLLVRASSDPDLPIFLKFTFDENVSERDAGIILRALDDLREKLK